MSTKTTKHTVYERGIAIYVAVVVTAALVLVSFSVIALAIKDIGSSAASRDSQAAFYAADSGIECALYWDLKNLTGTSAFATTSYPAPVPPVACNLVPAPITQAVDTNSASLTYGFGTSTFSFTFSPDPYCSVVTVVKSYDGAGVPKTKIESRGYNSCSNLNTRRVERAILVNY